MRGIEKPNLTIASMPKIMSLSKPFIREVFQNKHINDRNNKGEKGLYLTQIRAARLLELIVSPSDTRNEPRVPIVVEHDL